MTDYSAPLTNEQLILEVATGKLAFANKVKVPSVKALWDAIAQFIADTLRIQKGVTLPNLGNFTVGPVVGAGESAKKRIRPVFALLEGRYGNISQERARYVIGGHSPIVQPSYTRLAMAAAVHRGVCQRLVADLLQRLAAHIGSGRPIKVDFPNLGRLATNRAGRIEFVFEPLFMEYFDQELRERTPQDNDDAYSDLESLRSGMSRATVDSPYGSRPSSGVSRPGSAASSRPVSAAPPDQLKPPRVMSRTAETAGPHTDGLRALWQFCRVVDKLNSGAISRLKLEQWLRQDGRALLDLLDSSALLDLLTQHTYAKNEKYILYNRFVDSMEAALPSTFTPDGAPDSPVRELPYHDDGYSSYAPSPYGQQQQQAEPSGFYDPYPGTPGSYSGSPHPQQQQYRGYPPPQTPPSAGMYGSPSQAGRPPAVQVPGTPRPMSGTPYGSTGGGGPSSTSVAPSEPEDCMHYYQGELSPKSRKEYDQFNRMHFERQAQARGGDKRTVTPKVGQEPLNMQAYRAVQNSAPPSTSGSRLPSPFGRASPPMAQQPFSEGRSQRPPQPAPYASNNDSPAAPALARQASLPKPQTARSAASPTTQVSQYDIINERDPVHKQRLKADMARELQKQYSDQIREKQTAADSSRAAEHSWPYGVTNQAHDRRAISQASPQRR